VSRAQLVAGAPGALVVSRFRFAKLRRLHPRPVELATVPDGMPRFLSSEGYGPGLTDLVLAYGHPFAVHKPLIEVETYFGHEMSPFTSLGQIIARAEYRDACYTDLRWQDATDPFGSSRSTASS
jgi:hypothetical protein